MKLSKPISSPGRTDKFPPPLMRFLRSHAGSKSRGRSRSSPMFVRKKSSAIETQEPSSPKVTCMGQVRVRKSKTRANRTVSRRRRRCKCIRNPKFCKPISFRSVLRKWVLFFRFGFGKNVEIESKKRQDSEQEVHEDEDEDEHEDEGEEGIKVYVSGCSSSPPRNALLLSRSRSAPYRSSSLASRFLGSPLKQTECGGEEQKTEQEDREAMEKVNPKWEKESECKSGEGSIGIHPLILTRCKSEPGRRGDFADC